jgi:predicted SAM-dependent methyltransferase
VSRIRLHLGCGLVHRPGWINLDRFHRPAADVRADAGLLPFADASVQVIEAPQLVEHLGYVGTLYALYEWARLLAVPDPETPADGGVLRIETPDRTATLRAALSTDTREAALPWLFGAEQEGQTHRYLFSADELAGMARAAGFESVAIEDSGAAARPSFRLTARRGADTPSSPETPAPPGRRSSARSRSTWPPASPPAHRWRPSAPASTRRPLT